VHLPSYIAPTPAQEAWLQLGFGMFVHFNSNTFYHTESGDPDQDPARFYAKKFNPAQWAETAVTAGMKYAVISAKHHEGFCIWPTQLTDHNVMASPMARDVLRDICVAFQERGITTGLYFSLSDHHEPSFQDDDAFAEFVKGQLTELLTGYGPVLELWFDGGWEKGDLGWFDARRWHWDEIYRHVKSLQPDCLVLCNPGCANGGEVRMGPVDLNCIERVHLYCNEEVGPVPDARTGDFLYEPDTRPVRRMNGKMTYLPIESCDCIRDKWFYHPNDDNIVSAETILDWIALSAKRGGNLLLNVYPTDEGLILQEDRDVLAEVGRRRA